ncbi:MAG: amino acid permease, partial [Muribaculaceae bacterium]|nr:amino acid permease [Muribaculaceae bacterium]
MKENKIAEQVPVKLGFIGLTALVFGMVVGAGIFNIPQNMAHEAGLGAVIASWLITAVGILLLVATFKILADRHPEYDSGIYQYARDGYGRYVGFNVALCYWFCTGFAYIAYSLMRN